MRYRWLAHVKDIIRNFQLFELGNSTAIYYLLIFYLRPVLVFLGLPLILPLSPYNINYLALSYITFGLIFFILGYYNRVPVYLAGKVPNIFKKEWDFSRTLYVFGVLFTVGLGIKLFRIFEGAYSSGNRSSFFIHSSFSSFIGFLDWLSLIALVIAFISYFKLKKDNDGRYKLWRMLAWGSFAIEILYAFPSCIRANVIVPVLLYLLVRSFLVRIDYKVVVLCGLGISFFLFPMGNVCRHPQIAEVYNLTQSVRGDAKYGDISSAYEHAARSASFTAYLIAESFLSRIDQSNVFTGILEHPQPLLLGKPFLNFFVSLGPPRFIWKDKPMITANGNEFGHRIGVLSDGKNSTFVGATMVGDLYMNFGLIGIIAGMFSIGAMFRFIFDYLVRLTGASLSGLLIYSIVWIQLMKGFEDSLAPVFAGLVKVLVLLFAVALFLQGDVAEMWRYARRRINI